MPKARAWRKEGKPAKRTHRAATLSEGAMPTRERLAKADGGFEIGGKGEHRVVRMLDAPLEQMRARGQLTETDYHTLSRLAVHEFLGFRFGSLRSVDLNRVVVDCHSEVWGSSEAWHREMFFAAWRAMSASEGMVFLHVAVMEHSIVAVGAEVFGYRSPYRGRQAVLEALRSAAGKITSAWLTVDRP